MCVVIYCEYSEFTEGFCNVEQNSAGCRRRQSRLCCPRSHRRHCQLPVLSPAAVVDAASCRCCLLLLLLSGLAPAAWCSLPVVCAVASAACCRCLLSELLPVATSAAAARVASSACR